MHERGHPEFEKDPCFTALLGLGAGKWRRVLKHEVLVVVNRSGADIDALMKKRYFATVEEYCGNGSRSKADKLLTLSCYRHGGASH